MGKRTFTYKTAGGCAIKADVYSAGGGPRPVILWIHGGALIMGWRGGLSQSQRDRYLRAGYHVVSADYRLAAGMGSMGRRTRSPRARSRE